MRVLEMVVPNLPVELSVIKDFESYFKITLPNVYVEFLLLNNGGVPVNGIYHYDGNSSGVAFFGINTGESYNDLKWNFDIYKNRLPQGLLPIGSDPGGNLICLNLGDGSVFHWDHDRESLPPTTDNIYLISQSFIQFLNELEPDEGAEDW